MTAFKAWASRAGQIGKARFPPTADTQHRHFLSQTGVRVIRTPALRREPGEIGQRRVRPARSAAWMPWTKTGRSPGINSAENVVGIDAHHNVAGSGRRRASGAHALPQGVHAARAGMHGAEAAANGVERRLAAGVASRMAMTAQALPLAAGAVSRMATTAQALPRYTGSRSTGRGSAGCAKPLWINRWPNEGYAVPSATLKSEANYAYLPPAYLAKSVWPYGLRLINTAS